MYGYEGIITNGQYSVHVLSREYAYLKNVLYCEFHRQLTIQVRS
jgi:hypothetical protein